MISPALQLVDLVWKNCPYGGRSWQKYNHAMNDALRLAITACMKFDLDDFRRIADDYRFGYWGGNDRHMLGEQFYCDAVEAGNRSACAAFEHWKARKPFIYWPMFDRLVEGEDRLALGSLFPWDKQEAKVTSFTADGKALVACTYPTEEDKRTIRAAFSLAKVEDPDKAPREPKYPDIKNRYTITHEALQKARRELRKKLQAARPDRQRTQVVVQSAQEIS